MPWNSRPSGEKVFTPRSMEGSNTIFGVTVPLRTIFGAGQKHFAVAEVQARRVPFGQSRVRPGNNARIRGLGVALLSWIPISPCTDHQCRKFHKVSDVHTTLVTNGGFACSDNRCSTYEQSLWFGH